MNKYILLTAYLVGIMVVSSCSDDEIDQSSVTNVPISITSIVPQTINTSESNKSFTINFDLDEGQIVDIAVDVEVDVASTSATNGEDFSFEPITIDIPAYVRKGSFSFDVMSDLVAEGEETIVFVIKPRYEPFSIDAEQFVTVTIQDSVYSSLELTFDWEGSFNLGEDVFTICPNVDLDIYVLDADGNDLGIYGAATGACPEILTVDGWDDGDYFLASNLFFNGLLGYNLGVEYPITVRAVKGGVFDESFIPVDIWNSEDSDYYNGGSGFLPVLELNVSGTIYTISLPDGGEIIAQGIRGPKLSSK